MHVRRIREDDVEVYKRVRLAALADAPSAFGSTYERESQLSDDEWLGRVTATSSGDDRATFFAVDDDGEVVGLAGGYSLSPTEVHLISMWTSPAVRRRGAGRALIEAVLEFAGDRHVTLWVTCGNDAARTLYESMGFEATDTVQPLPSDPTREEVLMRLR